MSDIENKFSMKEKLDNWPNLPTEERQECLTRIKETHLALERNWKDLNQNEQSLIQQFPLTKNDLKNDLNVTKNLDNWQSLSIDQRQKQITTVKELHLALERNWKDFSQDEQTLVQQIFIAMGDLTGPILDGEVLPENPGKGNLGLGNLGPGYQQIGNGAYPFYDENLQSYGDVKIDKRDGSRWIKLEGDSIPLMRPNDYNHGLAAKANWNKPRAWGPYNFGARHFKKKHVKFEHDLTQGIVEFTWFRWVQPLFNQNKSWLSYGSPSRVELSLNQARNSQKATASLLVPVSEINQNHWWVLRTINDGHRSEFQVKLNGNTIIF